MTSTASPGKEDPMEDGIIELSVLDQFLAFRKPGAPDPRRRIINIYLDSTPMLMEAIKTAVNSADGILLSKSAHSLKSSSMNVGAVDFGSLCAKLERSGKQGSIEEAQNLVELVETQYTTVTAALKNALRQMD